MRAMFLYATMIGVLLFAPIMISFPVAAIIMAILPRVRALDGKWDWWQ